LRIISKYKPPGFIFGGAYYRTYFCVSDLGGFYTEELIHGGAYFLEFYSICFLSVFDPEV